MGLRGPAGKRDEERRRRNKDGVETTTVDIAELSNLEVVIPQPPMKWTKTVLFENEETGRLEMEEVDLDEPIPAWEPLTIAYWESFQRSGQAIFYEPSDWMTAYALMEVLDRWLKPQDIRVGEIRPAQQEGGEVTYLFEPKIVPIPGNVLSSILKGLTSLMATEGDRRRLSVELERRKAREAAVEGTVTDIVKRREDAFKTG